MHCVLDVSCPHVEVYNIRQKAYNANKGIHYPIFVY